jgi:hypothetical protein
MVRRRFFFKLLLLLLLLLLFLKDADAKQGVINDICSRLGQFLFNHNEITMHFALMISLILLLVDYATTTVSTTIEWPVVATTVVGQAFTLSSSCC